MIEADKKILAEIKNSPFGRVLAIYLEEEIGKIESVKGVKTLDEALGKQYALNLVEKLFNFLNRKEVSSLTKDQYE